MDFYVDKDTNIYHRADCDCLKNVPNKKILTTSSFNMYRLGYTPCRKCAPIYKYYDEHREAIGRIALENGLSLRLRDESLLIESQLSSWKLVCKPAYSGDGLRFKLYHENTQQYRNCDIVHGEIMKKYHDQEVHYKSIEENLEYIVQHDNYRKERNSRYKKTGSRTSKTGRYLYNRSKNRDINISTRRVYNLIEQLEVERNNNITNNLYK